MATIKSYTSIEQSKKLAEILPIESADMFHFVHEIDTVGFGYDKDTAELYSKTKFEYIPCWSLAALLGVLPEPNLLEKNGWHLFCDNEDHFSSSSGYNNPVDACYEMILKLHKLNLL